MAANNHLEYDKGPSLEDESDGDRDEPDEPEQPDDDGDGDGVSVAPWIAGLATGVGAFATVYAVIYHLVGTMFAIGPFAGNEDAPSQWVIAGLSTLASHGAVIEEAGEPVSTAPLRGIAGVANHVTALVPVFVLVLAGYLLVRYGRLETREEGAAAIGTAVVGYVALAIGLAQVATWPPDERSGGQPQGGDPEQLAAAVDVGTALSISLTVLFFVAVGAAIAALPRVLDPAGDDESDAT